MTFDVPTLVVVTAFISTIAGALLLLSWLQNRAVKSLACWGATYLIAAAAIAMLGARGHVPNFVSINIANALLATAAGFMWAGIRLFEFRAVSVTKIFFGAAIWLAACGLEPFYQSLVWRVSLASFIMFSYAALCVWELWRSRKDHLVLRWPAITIFAAHGLIYLLRIPVTLVANLPPDAGALDIKWLAFGIFEALFFSVSTAFVLVMMAKERVENKHRRASFIDPLTGIPNRRAFMDSAQSRLDECRRQFSAASIVIFDLDHFKAINDTHGHQVGDDILIAFCRVAEARLGGNELFARLGGEEFVLLLPELMPDHARELADRIRADFSVSAWMFAGRRVRATVSAGVCGASEFAYDLTRLMSAADQTLYRAKANGRNRIEGPAKPLTVVRSETTRDAG